MGEMPARQKDKRDLPAQSLRILVNIMVKPFLATVFRKISFAYGLSHS